MLGNSSLKDQLWFFALQLAEEAANLIQISEREEEHGKRIQSKYNQLVSNLSCLGDIRTMMYEKQKLTQKESEFIRSLESTPIRANEELLSIIAKKPRDVYECFLSLAISTNQLHLYQMLVSGDDACVKANTENDSDHKVLIRRNFVLLSEKLDTEGELIHRLYQQNVLTVREKESISSASDTFRKNEALLELLSRKSPKEFYAFLKALDDSGQGHLTEEIKKPGGLSIPHSVLPSSSKPVNPPKKLPEQGEKLIPSEYVSKPKPVTQLIAVQHNSKPILAVAKNIEKKDQYRKIKGVRLRAKLTELECQPQTEIAIKVASHKRLHLKKPENWLAMFNRILFRECYRIKKETVARNVETMKMEESLTKAECDKQFFRQQMQELKDRLATSENELRMSKYTFEENHSEMTLLKNERDKLNELCEVLKKDNETMNELEMQLQQSQENNRGLLWRLKETEHSLQTAEEEKNDHINKPTQESMLKENALESGQILKLQTELEIEKHKRKESDDKLRLATVRLEQVNRKGGGLFITSDTQESHVISNNYQFLVENIDSDRLINVLHEKNCLTNEDRHHLSNHGANVYRNDELLKWMREITFDQDNWLKVLECFREAKQNFVVDLLQKGGVIIKSKLSTKLGNESKSTGLFLKRSSENMKALKDKEIKVIEKLNMAEALSISINQSSAFDTAKDDIIIVPYCHQEDNGIVIWFWCQSRNSLRNLQSMYASDILLGKLVPIFKKFSQSISSSVNEVLAPTGITIFANDFKRNKKAVDFEIDPKFLLSIKKKAVDTRIKGLAALADEIFVVKERNSNVEVYNRISHQFQRSFKVDNLKDPKDIVACFKNYCLYIIDSDRTIRSSPFVILRVDKNGNILKKVWRGEYRSQLSVTDESNIILPISDKLMEITPDGELVHEIAFEVSSPWHAVKLSNDRFVVTCIWTEGGGICIVNYKGELLLLNVLFESNPGFLSPLNPDVAFPGQVFTELHPLQVLRVKMNVVVNRDGSFLLVNETGSQIMLLTCNLEPLKEFMSKRHTLRNPRGIFVDESNGCMLVAENFGRREGGSITLFNIAG